MKPKLLGVVWCYGLFNVHYEYVHNRIKNVLIHSTSVIGSSIIAWLGLQSYEVFLLTLQLDLLYLLYIYADHLLYYIYIYTDHLLMYYLFVHFLLRLCLIAHLCHLLHVLVYFPLTSFCKLIDEIIERMGS